MAYPRKLPLLIAAIGLCGCTPLALTVASVGGGIAASHQMSGLAYRTFPEPLPKVRTAVQVALRRMAIKTEGTEKMDLGERILARAGDRSIEIELEALTTKTTRVRAVARKEGGIIVDSATAAEIISQTEKSIRS